MAKYIKEIFDSETPGVVVKSVGVSSLKVTDDDLKKINKYSLETLTADNVFVFKVLAADNMPDDRNSMPFTERSIKDMAKKYIGKTMIKDHTPKTDNQIGRVFDAEIVDTGKETPAGEPRLELYLKVYMVKTESNADLIKEIKAGIKKEVSTSTVPKKLICSICGTDNMQNYCRHWPGHKYIIESGEEKGKEKTCQLVIDGVEDAYELSFVYAGAQPRAGTHKQLEKTNTEASQDSVQDKETEDQYIYANAYMELITNYINLNGGTKDE